MKNVRFLPIEFRKLNPELVVSKTVKKTTGDTSLYYEQKRISEIVPLVAWMDFHASPGDTLIRGVDRNDGVFEEFGWFYDDEDGNKKYHEADTGFYEIEVIVQLDNILVFKVKAKPGEKDNVIYKKQHLSAINLDHFQMSLSLLPEDCIGVFPKGVTPVDIRTSPVFKI